MTTAVPIISNFNKVSERIKKAALRSNRNPEDIEFITVTKYAPTGDVLELLKENKLSHIGEIKVQDCIKKWNSDKFLPYKNKVKKHFIGHLQSNKAKKAVEFFDYIDSVDSLKIARVLNRHSEEQNKKLPVMVQIKFTEKETQSGADIDNAPKLVEEISKMSNLIPCGYMAIAPISNDIEILRPVFKRVKYRFDKDFPETHTEGCKNYLSLGMSGDFEIAIEEGANLPRIGSAIFG